MRIKNAWYLKSLCLVVFSMFCLLEAQAANFTSTTNGDWDNGATWGNPGNNVAGSGYPGLIDNATVTSGRTVQVKFDQFVNDITINSGGLVNTSNNRDLTVVGNYINNGTHTGGNGSRMILFGFGKTMSGSGVVSLPGGVSVLTSRSILVGSNLTIASDLNFTNGITVTNNGAVTIVAPAIITAPSSATWVNAAYSTLSVEYATNILVNVALNASAVGNTVRYYQSSPQNIKAPVGNTYFNLKITGTGTKTMLSNLTVLGDITISSATLNTSTFSISLQGNWSNEGILSGTGTVIFAGGNAQSITNSSGEVFYNMTTSKSAGYLTLLNDVTVSNTLTLTSGQIDANLMVLSIGTSTTTLGSLNYTGGFVFNGFVKRWVNATGVGLLFPMGIQYGSYYAPIKVTFNTLPTTGALMVRFPPIPGAGNNGLPLVDNGTTVYNTFSQGVYTLTPLNGLSSNNYNVEAVGLPFYNYYTSTRLLARPDASSNWVANGTHQPGVAGTGPAKRANMTMLPADITLADTANCTAPNTTSFTGPRTVCLNSTTTYSVPNTGNPYLWIVQGGTQVSGGFSNSITVNWGSTGMTGVLIVIEQSACGSGVPYYDFISIEPTTTQTITGKDFAAENTTVGNEEVYSVPSIPGYTYAWSVTGGTIVSGGSTNSVSVSWGPAGSGQVSVAITNGCGTSTIVKPVTIYIVINSIASGSWNSPSTWDCNCIPSAINTVRVRNPHTVTLPNSDIFITNLISDVGGTFSNTTTKTLTVTGDIIMNGIYTGTTNLIQDGTGTISGIGSITTTGNFVISGGNKTILPSTSLTIRSNISISAGVSVQNRGTIYATGDIVGAATNSRWVNQSNGVLNVGGSLLITGTVVANAVPNTIEYTGNGSQNINLTTYYNLYNSGSGARVLPSTGTVGIVGSFLPGTNTYTTTGSTINFQGADQNIPAFTFNNFTASGSGIKTLTGNVSTNGTIRLSNGIVTTGTYVLIANNGSNIVRVNGYVNGNLRRWISNTTNTKFDIGTSSDYTPVFLAFSSVGTAGFVTVKSNTGDHPSIATSCFDPAKSVNEFVTITNNSATVGAATIEFNYPSGLVDPAATPANFNVKAYSASAWSSQFVLSGTPTSTQTIISGVTTFGDFQIGEGGISFSSHPTPAAVCSGTTLTFGVVSNASSPTYQWQVFSSGSWSTVVNGGVYSTATTATLTITGVLATMDTYQYRCLVTGSQCGGLSVASNAALLNVIPAVITVAGTDVATCSNVASVNITSGASTLNQSSRLWTSSGTGTFANANSLTTATYTPSAADKTAGIVTITLTGGGVGVCPAVQATKNLIIGAIPTAVAGTAITSCGSLATNITTGSSSTNFSSVTWSSNGSGVFANSNSLTTATYTPSVADISAGNRTLTLTAVGTGSCANVTSTKTITTKAIPVITTQPYDMSTCTGNTVLFKVVATGSGLTYQWLENGVPITNTGIYSGVTTATLTLTGVSAPNNYSVIVSNGCSVTSTVANLTVYATAPGDPTIYGNGVWNCYGYKAINFTNYAGYYIEPLLSFDTRNRWASASFPSNSTGYQGCSMPANNISISMKQTGFTPGSYTANLIGLDDGLKMYVDGVLVYTAVCCIASSQPVFWTGTLTATSNVELQFTQGGGASYFAIVFTPVATPLNTVDAGTIKGDQSICSGQLPSQTLASITAASATGCTLNSAYQWQSSVDSIVWVDIAGANVASYTIPSALAQTTWFRRAASNFCATIAYSNPVKVSVFSTPPGDPTVFGNNSWNAYVYNFTTTGYTGADNNWTDYKGVFTTPGISTANQGFNSTTIYNIANNPSSVSTYQGCLVGASLSGAQIKRQGFPDSTYQIDFNSDDAGYLYVDGILVYGRIGCCTLVSNVWTGTLNAASTVEYRYKNNGSNALAFLSITPITPTIPLYGGLIALSGPDTICAGNIPAPIITTDPALSSCSITYQWESADTLGFIDIAGATSADYTATTSIGISTTYRRKVMDACGQVSYTNIVSVIVGPTTPPNPSVYGNNVWIAYAYSAQNYVPATLAGSYVDVGASASDPSFDSRTLWNPSLTPSLAPTYIGCQIGVDNHSVIYKRQGFPAGTYSISEINDDACQLYINGVLVYTRNVWTPTFIIGVGAVYLDATSTVEFRWTEGGGTSFGGLTFLIVPTPAPLVAGTIANSSTTVCSGDTPNVFTSTVDATSGCFITYQWEQKTSGAYSSIAGATNSTYAPTSITVPTTYRRFVTDACGRIDSSNVVTIAIGAPLPLPNPAIFGSNVWKVYAYQDVSFSTLAGSYVDNGFSASNPSFDSRNSWNQNSTPSAAPGYVGCQVGVDFHGVIYKRQGFPVGTYQLDFLTDDAGSVYIDGVLVYSSVGCCIVYPNIWTGPLNASSTVEFRWVDSGGGNSYGQLTMIFPVVPTSLLGGTIATTTPIVCSGNVPAPITSSADASGGCYKSYQWESKTTGAYSNIVGATNATYTPTSITLTTTYRRKVTDACTNAATSNALVVTVGVASAPDTTVYGANVWKAYVYNSNNFGSGNLYGSYTDNGVSATDPSFDTRLLWPSSSRPSVAPGYSGCQVGDDNHSVIYKRQGFPAGTYSIGFDSDDYGYLYVNGVLVYSRVAGCCALVPNVWTGTLNATSKIEYRYREFAGGSYGLLNIISTTPAPLIAGTIAADQTICTSTIPAAFTSVANATSGCAITYQWQRSTTSATGPWSNVGGNSNVYTSGALTSTGGTPNLYYFRRSAIDCSTTGYSNVIIVTVNPLPSNAGTITGVTAVCSGQTGVTYSIPAVANATSYNWTLPSGSTITSGSGTNSITVTFGATSGNVRVQPLNSCGLGLFSTTSVTVTPGAPSAAGAIAGVSSVCSGQFSVSYTISAVANATSYTWTVPSGASIISGSTTNAITVTFGSNPGNVTVTPVNGCGSGTIASKAVTINPLPSAAGVISGIGSVCPNQTGVAYSITAVANATSYAWSLPTGATIASGGTTNSITVNFGTAAGNVVVTPINACGNGNTSSKTISVKSLPSSPPAITGATTVCNGNTNKLYSIPAVLYATSYVWTVPSGSTITSGAGTNKIRVTFGATSGDVTVTPSNSCGDGTTSTLAVIVYLTVPNVAGSITGLSSVCQNDVDVPYSIDPVPNATTYTYPNKPSGSTIISGIGTNAITLTLGTSSGTLTIRPSNACGTGATSSLAIAVNPPPTAVAGANMASCNTISPINITSGASASNTAGVDWTSSGTGGIANATSLTNALYSPSAADIASGSVIITLTATGLGTCGSAISTKTLTFSAPVAQTVSGTTTLCVGSTTTYTGTTSGGNWSSATPSVATVNASTGVVTGVSAGTSSISYSVTTAGGCVNTANQTIAISAPVAQTISGSTTLCIGSVITYTSTTAGGTYLSGTPSVATVNASTGVVTGVSAGTSSISYSVTTAGGCVNTANQTITVSACSFVWTGAVSTAWNHAGNWSTSMIPTIADSVLIPSGPSNMPIISVGSNAEKVVVNTGASISISANGILNVYGNFINNGTVNTVATSTISMKGSTPQSILGLSNVYNITIDNNAGVSLATAMTVNGAISLVKGVLTTNNNLTINFDNGGNVNYAATDIGSIVGSVSGRRDVVAKTHYIAAPFIGSTSIQIAQTTPLYVSPYWKMYSRNFTNQSWVAVINNTTAMPLGTGFSVSFPVAAPLVLTGTYNHAYAFTSAAYDNTVAGKYVLVGNPYPSTLDWNNGTGWTKTNIGDAIYLWNAANAQTGSYVAGVSTNGGTQFIPAMQSFLVRTTGGGGTATIGINNDARISLQNPSYWRVGQDETIRITLQAENSTQKDEAVIRFNDMATTAFDADLDAGKIMNGGLIPSVYTNVGAELYSINSLADAYSMTSILVATKLPVDGNYSLTIQNSDPSKVYVLIDKKLGTENLVSGPVYTFSGLNTDDVNRFELQLRVGTTTANGQSASNASGLQIYSSTKGFVLLTTSLGGSEAEIEILDLTGVTLGVYHKQVLNTGATYVPLEIADGAYVVKVLVDGKTFAQLISIVK